jgi:site-specific recombinase XerD
MKTRAAVDAFIADRAPDLSALSSALYRQQLGRLAATFEELPDKPEPVAIFLNGIRGKKITRYGYYRTFKAFYAFVKERFRRRNVMAGIRMQRPDTHVMMATLEPREQSMVLRAAANPRDLAIVTILTDTGIRAGELVTLNKRSIGDGYILVDGKTGPRFVPVSDETMTALHGLAGVAGKAGWLFPGYQDRPLSRQQVYRIVRSLMDRAGVHPPKMGPHRMRHAFGKAYLVNGGDVRSLQLLMGHRQISTTEQYTSLNTKDLEAKHHRFTPLHSAQAAAQFNFLDMIAKEDGHGG